MKSHWSFGHSDRRILNPSFSEGFPQRCQVPFSSTSREEKDTSGSYSVDPSIVGYELKARKQTGMVRQEPRKVQEGRFKNGAT